MFLIVLLKSQVDSNMLVCQDDTEIFSPGHDTLSLSSGEWSRLRSELSYPVQVVILRRQPSASKIRYANIRYACKVRILEQFKEGSIPF